MRVFSPPYRWSKRPLANLYWCAWDVVHGVKMWIRWAPVVWDDHDFDWEPMARMMIFKLRRMEPVLRNGIAVSGERHAREVAICRALLERLVADEYHEEARAQNPHEWWKKRDAQAKADLELFGKMFTRHLRSWWD